MGFLAAIPGLVSGLGSIFGGGGGNSSDPTGLQGALTNSQLNLEKTTIQDNIDQMDQKAQLDQVNTKSQMAASLTDTENKIAAAWQQVSSSKDQAEEAILKTDTQSTAQA